MTSAVMSNYVALPIAVGVVESNDSARVGLYLTICYRKLDSGSRHDSRGHQKQIVADTRPPPHAVRFLTQTQLHQKFGRC
jgi:hypothetical protein